MTEDQKMLFISIARLGIACGLGHHFEWLLNWIRSLDSWAKYEEIPQKELEAYECYVALYDDIAPDYHPTIKDIAKMLNHFYEKSPSAGPGS